MKNKIKFAPAKYLNESEMRELRELKLRLNSARTDREVFDLSDKFDLMKQVAYERMKYRQLEEKYRKLKEELHD